MTKPKPQSKVWCRHKPKKTKRVEWVIQYKSGFNQYDDDLRYVTELAMNKTWNSLWKKERKHRRRLKRTITEEVV